MHTNKVIDPYAGGVVSITTPVEPFKPTLCKVLKRMRWQDRGEKYDYPAGSTITLGVTPANDWFHQSTMLPIRFTYGVHFIVS